MVRQKVLISAFLLTLSSVASLGQPLQTILTIHAAPERPIIELREQNQFLNFDMIVRNSSRLTLRISQIQLSVYDSTGQLAVRKSINADAFAPSIAVIGKQVLGPGGSLDVFNPFSEFDFRVPLVKLQYSFCLLRESNVQQRERNQHRLPDDCDFRRQLAISPRDYQDKTKLILPLAGRVFVWEGHDFYAHHLRVPLGSPEVRARGITANSNSFAADFIYVDDQGRNYKDDPRKLENWYSYGKPIYAPGAGIILATANDIPENWFADANATRIVHPKLAPGKDPKDIGNFVLIDHQDGEYSLLVHMQAGSVSLRAGDHVVQGQPIGRIGFSGDSIFPHLHYSLMDGPEVFKAWGLPAYFLRFHRVLGATSVAVQKGPVDSGDFIQSDASYPGTRQ